MGTRCRFSQDGYTEVGQDTTTRKDETVTTIELTGGDLGSDKMRVACNLAEASAPVQVDYCEGDGWQSTQYQCADARHTTSGLIAIGKRLAARAVEVDMDKFECDAEEVE